jgi:signal transduction histidine kinase
MWGGKRVLSVLHTLSRYLLTLPLWVRLSSVILTTIFFIIVYFTFLPVENNTSILALPVAQAAWMFKRRGVFFTIVGIITALWIGISYQHHTLLPSPPLSFSFLIGIAIFLVIGILISSQRALLDIAAANQSNLEHNNERYQEVCALKDQLILCVNHELRTPLATVYGYLELLLEHQEHMDKQRQRDFLKKALYSCEELQLLVNNVLDTMQIHYEKPQFAVERLSITEIIEEVVLHLDPRRQKEHSLHLDVEEQLFVRANAQYVRQVLHNLLSNAFKYTPINTPVKIKATLYNREQEELPMVCVSVQDTGPGIPEHELPRLFGQFFRLERDVSRKIGGTGLGLYVCKQLVEAMGGHIWVESSGILGEGSLFRFTLPCDG